MSVVANLRPSLMAKSSAVRMKAEAGTLQAVAVECCGEYIAAPTKGGAGSRKRRCPDVLFVIDLVLVSMDCKSGKKVVLSG